jgi:adenylate kinase family enzyme
VIVVEGPDGAGKTTLARALASHYGFNIKNWGVERQQLKDEDPIARCHKAIRDSLDPERPMFIHDRLYISELIYGEVIRGEIAGTPEDHRLIRSLFWAIKPPVVVCLPPLDTVFENVKDETTEVKANIQEIYHKYHDESPRYFAGMSPMFYDYTGTHTGGSWMDMDRMTARIDHYIELRKDRTW